MTSPPDCDRVRVGTTDWWRICDIGSQDTGSAHAAKPTKAQIEKSCVNVSDALADGPEAFRLHAENAPGLVKSILTPGNGDR